MKRKNIEVLKELNECCRFFDKLYRDSDDIKQDPIAIWLDTYMNGLVKELINQNPDIPRVDK